MTNEPVAIADIRQLDDFSVAAAEAEDLLNEFQSDEGRMSKTFLRGA